MGICIHQHENLYTPNFNHIYMISLERAIYTVTYYWHGISKRAIHSTLWLFDKLHHLNLLQWSNVNGLPYNQAVANKIDEMIIDGHLRLTNRWFTKFGNSGLEPIQTNNSIKVYKPSQMFSEKFRKSVKYYLFHTFKFKQFYNIYEDKPIPITTFYKYIHNKILDEIYIV